jgi:hypothetical protein
MVYPVTIEPALSATPSAPSLSRQYPVLGEDVLLHIAFLIRVRAQRAAIGVDPLAPPRYGVRACDELI